MSTMGRRVAASIVAATALSLSGAALATNGYFTHGVGTESKGMAGAGIGDPTFSGPIAVASNPAFGVFVDDSWEVGLSFFSPRRSYRADAGFAGQGGAFSVGAGDFNSSSNWFPIPYVAKNWELANDRALTFVFYGRGGMNTDWDDAGTSAVFDPTGMGKAPVTLQGTFGDGTAGVDLSQAFMSVNYASRSGENFAWGIGPVFAIPRLLKNAGLTQDDIDLWELNEAFASQCLYCRDALDLPNERYNVLGGSISIGHPFGMTGARCVGHLLLEGKRRKAKWGVVTMCIGGGQGAAGLFEIF